MHVYIQVPLGILLKNENVLREMTEIMEELLKYVPSKETQKELVVEEGSPPETVITSHMHHILFGGDQLTVARIRGVIRQRQTSETAKGRMEGLVPVVEDWHAKVCLISVSEQFSIHKSSSLEWNLQIMVI